MKNTNQVRIRLAVSILCSAFSATAFGSYSTSTDYETFTASNVGSYGEVGDLANITLPSTLAGGYMANEVRVSGVLDNTPPLGNTATYASEAQILIGGIHEVDGGVGTTYTGPLTITNTSTSIDPFDPANTTFEFIEGFDDNTAGPDPDQTWTSVSVSFHSTVITNESFSAGVLPSDATPVTGANSNVENGYDIWEFTIPADAQSAASYLSIESLNPGTGNGQDLELFLYDGLSPSSTLIANDDTGLSLGGDYLSFGAEPLYGGVDGVVLVPGTYTLLVAAYDATTGDGTLGDFTAGDINSGDYSLRFIYSVPEPSSVLLLLAGFLGMGVCRRK